MSHVLTQRACGVWLWEADQPLVTQMSQLLTQRATMGGSPSVPDRSFCDTQRARNLRVPYLENGLELRGNPDIYALVRTV